MERKSSLSGIGTPSETTDRELDAATVSGGRTAPRPSVDQKAASAQTHGIFTCNYFPSGN